MQKNILYLLTICFLLTACASSSLPVGAELPTKRFDISWSGEDWHEAYSNRTEMMEIREFVRRGDKIEEWKELITEQSIIAKLPNAMAAVEALNQGLNRKFKTFDSNIISESEREVIYEWWQSDEGGYGPEHVISLVLWRTQYSITTITYAKKGPKMSEAEIKHWVSRFKNLKYQ